MSRALAQWSMTANTSIPRAATTADRRARVSAGDHGLDFVTMAGSMSLRRSGMSSVSERSLGIATPGITRMDTILDPGSGGRLAPNDSIFGVGVPSSCRAAYTRCRLLVLRWSDFARRRHERQQGAGT